MPWHTKLRGNSPTKRRPWIIRSDALLIQDTPPREAPSIISRMLYKVEALPQIALCWQGLRLYRTEVRKFGVSTLGCDLPIW